MSDIIARMGAIRQMKLNLAKEFEKDFTDQGNIWLLSTFYRDFGVIAYVLEKDMEAFKKYLSDSASLSLQLIEMYKAGKPVDSSYVTILNYQELFSLLAIGDFDKAEEFAEAIGFDPKLDKQQTHPYDRALGYCLKAFVLGKIENADELIKELRKRSNKSDVAYCDVFQAILDKDDSACNKALKNLLKGHKRLGRVKDTLDEALCVWGIGMANLAVHYGLKVDIDDSLLPKELY